MMSAGHDDNDSLRQLSTKYELVEQLHRWARSADRNDRALMLSVFLPDANIDYGFFSGPTEQFCNWVLEFHAQLSSTSHYILNPLIRLDGDRGYSESCVRAHLRFQDQTSEMVISGRYLDRWERRNGQWRIADRVAIVDRYEITPITLQGAPEIMSQVNFGLRDAKDPSYRYL